MLRHRAYVKQPCSANQRWRKTGAVPKRMRRGHTFSRSGSPAALPVLRPVALKTEASGYLGGRGARRLDFVPDYEQPVRGHGSCRPLRPELPPGWTSSNKLRATGKAFYSEPRFDAQAGWRAGIRSFEADR